MKHQSIINSLIEAHKKVEIFFQGHGAFKNLPKESTIKFWPSGTSKEPKTWSVLINIVQYLQLWDFHLCPSVLNNLTIGRLGWALTWRSNLPHSSCPSACLYPRVDPKNKNTLCHHTLQKPRTTVLWQIPV